MELNSGGKGLHSLPRQTRKASNGKCRLNPKLTLIMFHHEIHDSEQCKSSRENISGQLMICFSLKSVLAVSR